MYGTVAGFKAYATYEGYNATSFTDQQIESRIDRSSSLLDSQYRARFVGVKPSGQLLEWGRTGVVGVNSGFTYPDNAIPTQVENSTYELAYRNLMGDIGQIKTETGAVTSESKSLVSGMNKSVTYSDKRIVQSTTEQTFDYIDILMSDLISAQSGGMLKLVKGCR